MESNIKLLCLFSILWNLGIWGYNFHLAAHFGKIVLSTGHLFWVNLKPSFLSSFLCGEGYGKFAACQRDCVWQETPTNGVKVKNKNTLSCTVLTTHAITFN